MKKIIDFISELKDADMAFDMICTANYFKGQADGKIPVEENREAFEFVKKLLK